MQSKTIEVFETFPDGTIKVIDSGKEDDLKISKLISKILFFKAKQGKSNFSWRLIES